MNYAEVINENHISQIYDENECDVLSLSTLEAQTPNKDAACGKSA